MSPSAVTTHVLDAGVGRPAAGVPVSLEGPAGVIASATTDGDGRVRDLGPAALVPGIYRLRFDTGAYFAATGTRGFYPEVVVTFEIDGSGASSADAHLHVPLLLSPYGYSTYRGS